MSLTGFPKITVHFRGWALGCKIRQLTAQELGCAARAFFDLVLAEARTRDLSGDHFTVDGTLLEAWASQKSFRRMDEPRDPPSGDRNPEIDFRGEKRSNVTHRSTTDPDARLARKGNTTAKLCYVSRSAGVYTFTSAAYNLVRLRTLITGEVRA